MLQPQKPTLTPEQRKQGKFVLDQRPEHVINEEADDRAPGRRMLDWAVNKIKSIDYGSLRAEVITRILDGTMGKLKEFGPWEKNIFVRALKAYESKLRNIGELDARMAEIFKNIDMRRVNDKIVTATLRAKDGELFEKRVSIAGAMAVYAYSQNESGLAHLEGSGYITEGEEGYEKSVKKIIDALPKEYKAAVDAVIDYLDDEQYGRMNPVFKREHLIDMAKESRYFPLRGLVKKNDATAAELIEAENRARASVKKGMTKGRVESRLEFRELNFFNILIPALREAEHYIAMNDAVRDINRLLGHETVSRALAQRNPHAQKELGKWLKSVAAGREYALEGNETSVLLALKRNYTVGVLGFNLLTAMKQLDSIVQGTVRIKGGYWRVPKAVFDMVNPLKWGERWRFAQDSSVFMRNRSKSIEAALNERMNKADATRYLTKKLGERTLRVDAAGVLEGYRNAAMWITQGADMAVVTALWNARYDEVFNEVYGREYKRAVAEVGGGDYILGEGEGSAEMYRKGMKYDEARQKLLGLLGENSEATLENDNDGERARLSKSSIGKLVSNDAVQKTMNNGFTREQHYAVASDIETLFKNSVKISSHPDKNGNADLTFHRFGAPLHIGDNIAYITVKESKQYGKRMYTVEAMEIKKLVGMLEEARDKSPTHFPSTSLNEGNIRKLLDAVNANGGKLEGMLEEAKSNSATFPASNVPNSNITDSAPESKEKIKKDSNGTGGPAHDRAAAVAHEAAFRSADTLIRRSQPMFDKIFLPSSLRGDDAVSRLFSMFLNQQNQNWNNLHEIILGAKGGGAKGIFRAMGQAAVSVALPSMVFRALSTGKFLLPAAFMAAVNRLRGDGGDDEDEEELKRRLDEWEDYVDNLAEYTFGGVPLFGLVPIAATRLATNEVRKARGRKRIAGRFTGISPVVSAWEDIVGVAGGDKAIPASAKLVTQVAGLPGWIGVERVARAWNEEDPASAIWSRRLREDTGVFAAMAARYTRGVGGKEWGKYEEWYEGLDSVAQSRFEQYYRRSLDQVADRPGNAKFALVDKGLRQDEETGNARLREWAEEREAAWEDFERSAYNIWKEMQDEDRANRAETRAERAMDHNEYLEKVLGR